MLFQFSTQNHFASVHFSSSSPAIPEGVAGTKTKSEKLDSLFSLFSAFKKGSTLDILVSAQCTEKELAQLAANADITQLLGTTKEGGGTEEERKSALILLRKLSRDGGTTDLLPSSYLLKKINVRISFSNLT